MNLDSLTFITADRTCDCILGVGTVSNIVNIFVKVALLFVKEETIRENFYCSYLKDKSFLHCMLLAIPGVSFAVLIYRWNNKRQGEKLVEEAKLMPKGLKADRAKIAEVMAQAAKYYHPEALAKSEDPALKRQAAYRGHLDSIWIPELAAKRGRRPDIETLILKEREDYFYLAFKYKHETAICLILKYYALKRPEQLGKLFKQIEQLQLPLSLATCHANGWGTPQNMDEAVRLFKGASGSEAQQRIFLCANHFFNQKQYANAIQLYRINTTELLVNNEEEHYFLAHCLFEVGETAEALATMRQLANNAFYPAISFLILAATQDKYGLSIDSDEYRALLKKQELIQSQA